MVMQMKNKPTYSQDTYRSRKYKDILQFIKSLGLEDREKLIDEIQVENYFLEYDNSEVVKNNR